MFTNFNKKVILDIGYGKSAITVFQDERILYYNILPVGGKHITSDISLLLKIKQNDAEKLKKNLNQSEITFENSDKETSELSNKVILLELMK